jgi:hypothetical protein
MINNRYEEKGNAVQHWITKLIVLSPPNFGKSDYESISKYKNKLIFIEKKSGDQSVDNYIPCLFYRNPNSSNYLIYFHGNSEHIFQIEYYGLDFRSYLDMNIIIVEYPGYSIYPCEDPESKIFFNNALIVYDWIKKKFKASDDQIFVCGRSLGTASAIFLSSQRNPKAVFLISAFTSLKNVGKDYSASIFLEEIFNSYRYITNIKCPILFIHGEKDSLINFTHSIYLYQEMKKTNPSVDIQLNRNMTHNDFNLKEDIICPIKEFIDKNKLKSNENGINLSEDELNNLYETPQSILKMIESKLFDLNKFQFKKKIPQKNAIFYMKSIDNNIIFTSGSKILMYNMKNYDLEEEIDINKNHPNSIINSLFQMKNKNFVCGTNLGDIIVFAKDSQLEEDICEDSDDTYKEIKHIPLNEKIYKIDIFLPNFICVLTKNKIIFYDDNFNEKMSKSLAELYTNFAQISNDRIAMLSDDHLSIFKIKENSLQQIDRYNNIKSNNLKNILIATNKYILVGGLNFIYYLDFNTIKQSNEKYVKNIIGEINYIQKIHDESFLACTSEGTILHITFDQSMMLDINERTFLTNNISSLFVKNFKTILLTDENNIQLWNNPNNNNDNCYIF